MTQVGKSAESHEELSLSEAAKHLLDECRMVLPGIQALFGFQLIAVFSAGFSEKLSNAGQRLHWVAIALMAIAVALIMTPAAFHRQRGGRHVDETFLHVSGRLLLWSMLPLALAICLDFYLIGTVILPGSVPEISAVSLFVLFITLWFGLPRLGGFRRRTAANSR
jgi:predicted metal-binding membrane protein